MQEREGDNLFEVPAKDCDQDVTGLLPCGPRGSRGFAPLFCRVGTKRDECKCLPSQKHLESVQGAKHYCKPTTPKHVPPLGVNDLMHCFSKIRVYQAGKLEEGSEPRTQTLVRKSSLNRPHTLRTVSAPSKDHASLPSSRWISGSSIMYNEFSQHITSHFRHIKYGKSNYLVSTVVDTGSCLP